MAAAFFIFIPFTPPRSPPMLLQQLFNRRRGQTITPATNVAEVEFGTRAKSSLIFGAYRIFCFPAGKFFHAAVFLYGHKLP
jgi:hypothetical protein